MIAATSQTTTPNVVRDIVDDQEARELFIVGREMERPPYFMAGKGGDLRLAKALRVCSEHRVTPNSDGSFTVEGSEGRTYRVTESCSCPNSQKGKTKYCYHLIATCIYVEWQRRLRPVAPVALGTLRAGTAPLPTAPMQDDDEPRGNGYPVDDETLPLPLPPTTAEERLAQASPHLEAAVQAYIGTSTTHTPQEDRMDDNEYSPEPVNMDDAPVATLERPTPEPARVTHAVREGYALLPSLDAESLKRSMQEWSAQRQVIRSFLQQEMKEGIDFYRLQVRGKDANPSLSKAGAEKFLGLFQLQASFAPDLLTWEMLGKPTDHVIYICTLRTRSGEIVGEGRGSRSLKKDSGDTNKAIKMSEKSALIDAVLRTGALSEVYTQDAEDMQEDQAKAAKPSPLHPSAELRQRIWAKVQELAPEVKTREAVAAFITARTGMDLHPDFYGDILTNLSGAGR